MRTEIAIAGGSVAGLAAATELSKKGYQIDIFDRVEQPSVSTPNFSSLTAGMLGISELLDPHYAAKNLQIKYPPPDVGEALNVTYNTPRYTARMNDLVSLMRNNVEALGVPINQGRVTDVIIDEGAMSGLVIDEKTEVEANIVLDASGPNAVVTNLAREQESAKIKETHLRQPSTLVGLFAKLDLPQSDFPDDTIQIGLLPDGITFFSYRLSPLNPQEKATHLLLLEGNQRVMANKIKEVNNEKRPLEERRLLLMKAFMDQTPWLQHFDHLQPADITDTMSFNYNRGAIREVTMDGLAPIGDAQGHENPRLARGLKHVAHDVRQLANSIQSEKTLIDGLRAYNRQQRQNYQKIKNTSESEWSHLQTLHPSPLPEGSLLK